MGATKIMLIRHAERPPHTGGKPWGVAPRGQRDPDSLTVRGWQRSGALASFFASPSPPLAAPDFIFAHGFAKRGQNSRRPEQTVTPLADKLGLVPHLGFLKGQEAKVAAAALAKEGAVLVCWDHGGAPLIAKALMEATGTTGLAVPAAWPADRSDLVWVLDRQGGSGPFTSFTQVPQLLLAGDLSDPIAT